MQDFKLGKKRHHSYMLTASRHGILLEMLSSYVSLASTLNLSQTVEILGSTRQTVRRHIRLLEEIKGEPLFVLHNRQYQLTVAGQASLQEAQNILRRSEAWVNGGVAHLNGLEQIRHEGDDGATFYSQQHHLNKIWETGTPLLQKGFACWAQAHGQIENPEMKWVRPYMLIYRKMGGSWQCVEIGEKSAYAKWFGWAWVKSSVGHVVSETPGGAESAVHVLDAYEEIYKRGGARFDHQYRTAPRASGGVLMPAKLKRLLVSCTFPNGDAAIGSVVEFTSNIDLSGINDAEMQDIPAEVEAELNSDGL
ncbi:MAG TPA: LysR family transcriptional regulator [Rhodobacterales bacterium]|nr:LysR family transcriptional regulator [Rhodobacterales bacterium]